MSLNVLPSSYVRRITRKLKNDGIGATLGNISAQLFRPFTRRYREGLNYDRLHNIDTSVQVGEYELGYGKSGLYSHNNSYGPVQTDVIDFLFKKLQLDYKEFEFIDLGSGKGRALFKASDYPFRQITGVEFSSLLNDVAQKNINNFRSNSQKCFNLRAICADAAAYPVPDENILFYLYNPFDDHILSNVMKNIERAIDTYDREIIIVYSLPVHYAVLDRSDYFSLQDSGECAGEPYRIYRRRKGDN